MNKKIVNKYVNKSLKQINKQNIILSSHQHFISKQLSIWNIFSDFQFDIDMHIITLSNYKLMTKLRTFHNKLNLYQHVLKHFNYYKTNNININQLKIPLFTCNAICCKDINKGMCLCNNHVESV